MLSLGPNMDARFRDGFLIMPDAFESSLPRASRGVASLSPLNATLNTPSAIKTCLYTAARASLIYAAVAEPFDAIK